MKLTNIKNAIRQTEHIQHCVDVSYPDDTVLQGHIKDLLGHLDDMYDDEDNAQERNA